MRQSIVAVLAAAALAGGLATPSIAADTTASVTVSYADLDVADPAGANALTQRIDAAVEKVCHRPDIALRGMVSWEECKAGALAGAMSSSRSPRRTPTSRSPAVSDRAAATGVADDHVPQASARNVPRWSRALPTADGLDVLGPIRHRQ